ncbi:hypothetical protein MKEN_00690500 [Mycena kentingensis (nom. inval.)]|nr:hypothetical protein MKEN_00690500 [Mycena kentingensis (nom. inval.)]
MNDFIPNWKHHTCLFLPAQMLASAPSLLWELYLDWLWNWTDHPSSWVSRIAYTCRILAILILIPVLVLILLDIASYGIARTLGVIDLTSASTSDRQTIHSASVAVPSVQVDEPHSPSSATSSASSSVPKRAQRSELTLNTLESLPPLNISGEGAAPAQPDAYFTSEPNSLKLSGVGLFSPAASRPPSPTITRKSLPPEDRLSVSMLEQEDGEDGIVFVRKRTGRTLSKPQARDEDDY